MVEGSSAAIYPRVNTMPQEIAEKLELPVGLERSKTERQRHNNVLADEAAQIFDDRIPVQQKVKIFWSLQCSCCFCTLSVPQKYL